MTVSDFIQASDTFAVTNACRNETQRKLRVIKKAHNMETTSPTDSNDRHQGKNHIHRHRLPPDVPDSVIVGLFPTTAKGPTIKWRGVLKTVHVAFELWRMCTGVSEDTSGALARASEGTCSSSLG